MTTLRETLSVFNQLVMIGGLGFLTALIQKLTVLRLKDNVQLSYGQLLIETGIVVTTVLLYMVNSYAPLSNVVSTNCLSQVAMSERQ